MLLSGPLLVLLAGVTAAADGGATKTLTPAERRRAKDELLVRGLAAACFATFGIDMGIS